ncbi:4Fe-4S single cluster domain-containing protein [Glutamicibacter protophormiae]|uniref:4Fe-4S single cluster domain-containing protein n=1 Tax=Glutamicibacter protophormiae TaxID=37930 RepID=UPI002A80A42C|nr:4Fe-4S single cluster domain-containing protein [Glutamicibacter protophormiae]WPR63626.1 4Fe-4S single cluster domain-containing protein [Glutamicibacter protophormiae]WPR67121.1 4Fe-4S single cluster domain-containing protein [Glutamicibacter protophormiae]
MNIQECRTDASQSTPPIALSRVVSGVTTLGAGRRVGIWVQGCALACTGCASIDTWDRIGGTPVSAEDLAEQVLTFMRRDRLTGITLTGGEPVDQSPGLARMLDMVARDSVGAELDILMFTGYAVQAARKRGAELFARIDTVIAGPYRQGNPSSQPLIASSNQQLVHLTERGAGRQEEYPPRKRLQLLAQDGDLTLVGLPAPGDLEEFRMKLAVRGVELGGVSWQA